MSDGDLRHLLLDSVGVRHGFGLRDGTAPAGVVRPVQVHGASVVTPRNGPGEADAIVSTDTGFPVGIVTADCVPVLAATGDGRAVAAVHAGWRGLAAGVVANGMTALRRAGGGGSTLAAVIGPHIGLCCYEVDEPVLGPLRARFGDAVDDAVRPSADRPGHWMIDLGFLVDLDLERAGVSEQQRGRIQGACTFCDPGRFHSYRRDGEQAGRLLHFIQAGAIQAAGDPRLKRSS